MKSRFEKALEVSRLAHINDKRWGGESYFEGHILPVIEIAERKTNGLSNLFDLKKDLESIKIVAALHDVVEDHADIFGIDRLVKEVTLTKEEVTALKAVTKLEGENYLHFTNRIVMSNLIAKVVKLSDLEHNMSDLKEGSLKDKYRFAQYLIQNSIWND